MILNVKFCITLLAYLVVKLAKTDIVSQIRKIYRNKNLTLNKKILYVSQIICDVIFNKVFQLQFYDMGQLIMNYFELQTPTMITQFQEQILFQKNANSDINKLNSVSSTSGISLIQKYNSDVEAFDKKESSNQSRSNDSYQKKICVQDSSTRTIFKKKRNQIEQILTDLNNPQMFECEVRILKKLKKQNKNLYDKVIIELINEQ